ncbi:MAG: hypothetical protein RLZZ436_634 [Planctomycetota bacterium]|jgi:hypothetical protein
MHIGFLRQVKRISMQAWQGTLTAAHMPTLNFVNQTIPQGIGGIRENSHGFSLKSLERLFTP